MPEGQESSLPFQVELAKQPEIFRPLERTFPVTTLTTEATQEEVGRRRQLAVAATQAAVLVDKDNVIRLIGEQFPELASTAERVVDELVPNAQVSAKAPNLHFLRPELYGPVRDRLNRAVVAMTFGQAEFAVLPQDQIDAVVLGALTQRANSERLILPQVGILTYEAAVRKLERRTDLVELDSTIVQGVYLSVGEMVQPRTGTKYLNVRVGGTPVRIWHPDAQTALQLSQNEIEAQSRLAAKLQGLAMLHPYSGGLPGLGIHHR